MRRIRIITLLAAGLAVSLAMAAEVTVTADPPLPVANLVKNPGFEQNDGTAGAADWKFGTANPENFRQGWIAEGHSGPGSLWLEALSGVMSGYWNQSVPVKPETDYLLRVWYRLAGGKMLIYAHGGNAAGKTVDQRFYDSSNRNHWLVPVFVKPEYMRGSDPREWRLCRLPFRTVEQMEWVAVSLGIFFTAGQAWFDDVSITEAKTDLTVTVQGPVQQVRVLDGAGEVLFETGASGGLTKALPGVATDAVYTVEVTEPGGKVTRVKYPGEGE